MSNGIPEPTNNENPFGEMYPGWLSCNTTLSDNPNYPGVNNCGFNFNNDGNTSNDNAVIEQEYEDMINLYGIAVDYYVNNYDKFDSANNFNGTDLTKKYNYPVELKMYVKYNIGSVSLVKFGYVSADELEAIILIKTYTQMMSGLSAYTVYGQPCAPKAGDIIKLTNFGKSRPIGMDGKLFICTERLDEDPDINQLGGHYVWKLKFARLQYSYEGVEDSPDGAQNFLAEAKNQQTDDDTIFGRLLSGENFPTSDGTTTPNEEGKVYPYDRKEKSETLYPWLSSRNNTTNDWGY